MAADPLSPSTMTLSSVRLREDAMAGRSTEGCARRSIQWAISRSRLFTPPSAPILLLRLCHGAVPGERGKRGKRELGQLGGAVAGENE